MTAKPVPLTNRFPTNPAAAVPVDRQRHRRRKKVRRYRVRLTTLARYSGSLAYRSAIPLSPKWRMGMPWAVTVHQPAG